MIIKTDEELKHLEEIGQICGRVLKSLVESTKAGKTTKEIDELGGKLLKEMGAESAPVSEYDFPGFTCISVNEEVAHGIPGKRELKEGDLVNIDVSAKKNGYFADTGISFIVGESEDPMKQKVVDVCEEALDEAIKKIKLGKNMSQIVHADHKYARKNGLYDHKKLTDTDTGIIQHDIPQHHF